MTMTPRRSFDRYRQPFHFERFSSALSAGCRGLASAACLLVFSATLLQPTAVAGENSTSHPELPGLHWRQLGKPEERGWSSQKLAVAKAYADSLDTAALM